jgi:hypothetical protein
MRVSRNEERAALRSPSGPDAARFEVFFVSLLQRRKARYRRKQIII